MRRFLNTGNVNRCGDYVNNSYLDSSGFQSVEGPEASVAELLIQCLSNASPHGPVR